MRAIPSGRVIIAACFCLAIAGCGTSGAAKSPPTATKSKTHAAPTATPTPTSVTPELTSYAQLAQPVVKSGVSQVLTLLKEMRSTSPSSLGRTCVTAGGSLASNRDAFTALPLPAAAKKFYGRAKHAYSITLGATDECGIAADTNSSGDMATAARDLRSGLGELNSTEAVLAGWAARH